LKITLCFAGGFLLGLSFLSEDGCDMSLRNVRLFLGIILRFIPGERTTPQIRQKQLEPTCWFISICEVNQYPSFSLA
jgi:hypothetical protein